jgi:micrococcal nuclease
LDSKTGQSIPVTPLKLDPNVKYLKPVTVVKADRSGGQKGVITYVGDGDGANIDVGGSTIKCRLDTFDAPETGGSPKKWPDQPYSREAENKLKSLIASGEVTVIVSKPADTSSPPSGKNNYGRSLCKIEVQGKNVDQEMLRSGAAWLRLEYATDEKLINLFNTAKTNKVGLFADPNAKAPWDYRNSFR